MQYQGVTWDQLGAEAIINLEISRYELAQIALALADARRYRERINTATEDTSARLDTATIEQISAQLRSIHSAAMAIRPQRGNPLAIFE